MEELPAEESLGALFNKYGSDKDRNGYTEFYDSIFKNIRNQPVSLLEVGIGTLIPDVPSSMVGFHLEGYKPGGSLRAWRDYFPKGQILGCDIQPDTQFTEPRIATVLANSTSREEVDRALGSRTFNVIIDDGSHYDEHQVDTLKNLWHRLKGSGYYIIEDIQPWSRISTDFRKVIADFVGPSSRMFFTEHKNVLIISKERPPRRARTRRGRHVVNGTRSAATATATA
jgi:hypothetical protein